MWARIMHTLYCYRGWWVDAPTIALLGLFYWHFYSKGFHAVPSEMPAVCWAILGMYWVIKEGVRWKLLAIQSRRGSILVAIWLLTMIQFFIVMAAKPGAYSMPPKMVETTLIVLGGFLGLQPIKLYFARKYPRFKKQLIGNDL